VFLEQRDEFDESCEGNCSNASRAAFPLANFVRTNRRKRGRRK